MRAFLSLISLTFVLFIAGCTSEEGTGGIAKIKGTVIIHLYNNGVPIDTFGAQEERVYLTFGENKIYDLDTRTHHNGQYKFEDLKPGNYTAYAYSDCDTCIERRNPMEVDVTIGNSQKEVTAPHIIIEKHE